MNPIGWYMALWLVIAAGALTPLWLVSWAGLKKLVPCKGCLGKGCVGKWCKGFEWPWKRS